MLRKTVVLLAALTVAGFVLPAFSQEDEGGDRAQAIGAGIYVGYLLGDEITEISVEGLTPELDDSPIIGGVFYIDVSRRSRYELRLGFSPVTVINNPKFTEETVVIGNSEFTNVEFEGPKDVDASLFYLDIAYIPRFGFGDSKLRMGIPLGLGWGTLLEDGAFVLRGQVPGRDSDLELSGGSGMSYFVGVQATYPISDRMEVFFDSRIKRYHRLSNVAEQNVQVVEGHFGVLWSF